MIPVNPHEGRFDNFETLPMINSKYGNSFKLEIKKNLGRKEASPSNAGHQIRIDNPNCPANTSFYNEEIPKFFPGQPGFKKHKKIEDIK